MCEWSYGYELSKGDRKLSLERRVSQYFFFFFLAETQTRINLLYVEPEVLLNPPPRAVAENIYRLLELE